MNSFSQRKGIKPVKSIIQVDDMDENLRNGLWNALTIFFWERVKGFRIHEDREVSILFRKIWVGYFKRPLDTLDDYWEHTYEQIRKYFFSSQWYEVYDFIEFVANEYPDNYGEVNSTFMESCNYVLERELSAYRFVGGKITQITSEEEISEIDKALETSKPLKAVNTHLKRALDLLADRKSPDYRNSVNTNLTSKL